MNRRTFINQCSILSAGACFSLPKAGSAFYVDNESSFAKHLHPVGRALELEGYYVWCNSPIRTEDGKIHLFFSRWKEQKKMGGWINGSEIAHAVADSPESEFKVIETVLTPRGGTAWDATTCHNPLIKKFGDQYCLFYMGNSNGKTNTKRIGLATADSIDGPWKRPDQPLLLPGPEGSWDDHCTTNPAVIKKANADYWLYYKSWNTKEYETSTDTVIKGNRKYGLAIAKQLEGPYIKYEGNPVIDFSSEGKNTQFEDAFVWQEHNKIWMIAKDMGYFGQQNGIIMETKNGIRWSVPKIAYLPLSKYIQEPAPHLYLKKYGRFERPQILFENGKPAYLFTATQGGKYQTASSFIFRIQ